MSIIDYLLIAGLLTATFYALYATLIGWLRTPGRGTGEASKMKASGMKTVHSRSDSLRRSAAVHAFSR